MINYYLIKNKYEHVKYNYVDVFDIKIYYLDDNNGQIIVKRLDSSDGWGLLLYIKIYNIENHNIFETIYFGNSDENTKTIYFKTELKLIYEYNSIIKIPTFLQPRKIYLINNKYTINSILDLNIVIYYINDYKIQIIIRRLDDEGGWNDNYQIVLYDNDIKFRKEIIHINNSKINYKCIFHETKIKVSYNNYNYYQEIPKIIFQSGNSDIFDNILHFNSVLSFIESNPEYTYIYYNNINARKFIRNNFKDDINNAYDLLIPDIYKTNLLKYCFLYNKGGCCIDYKQGLKGYLRDFITTNNNTLFLCNDINEEGIICSTPKNNIIEKIIKDYIYNINTTSLYKNINIIKTDKIINSLINKNFSTDEIYYKNFQIINKYKIYIFPNNCNDIFLFDIKNTKLIIKKINSKNGWNFDMKILIINEEYNERIINVGISKNNIKEILLSE
jgi:hypothetical protein